MRLRAFPKRECNGDDHAYNRTIFSRTCGRDSSRTRRLCTGRGQRDWWCTRQPRWSRPQLGHQQCNAASGDYGASITTRSSPNWASATEASRFTIGHRIPRSKYRGSEARRANANLSRMLIYGSWRPDWLADDAVPIEPVSVANSLLTGEINREFAHLPLVLATRRDLHPRLLRVDTEFRVAIDFVRRVQPLGRGTDQGEILRILQRQAVRRRHRQGRRGTAHHLCQVRPSAYRGVTAIAARGDRSVSQT